MSQQQHWQQQKLHWVNKNKIWRQKFKNATFQNNEKFKCGFLLIEVRQFCVWPTDFYSPQAVCFRHADYTVFHIALLLTLVDKFVP